MRCDKSGNMLRGRLDANSAHSCAQLLAISVTTVDVFTATVQLDMLQQVRYVQISYRYPITFNHLETVEPLAASSIDTCWYTIS